MSEISWQFINLCNCVLTLEYSITECSIITGTFPKHKISHPRWMLEPKRAIQNRCRRRRRPFVCTLCCSCSLHLFHSVVSILGHKSIWMLKHCNKKESLPLPSTVQSSFVCVGYIPTLLLLFEYKTTRASWMGTLSSRVPNPTQHPSLVRIWIFTYKIPAVRSLHFLEFKLYSRGNVRNPIVAGRDTSEVSMLNESQLSKPVLFTTEGRGARIMLFM